MVNNIKEDLEIEPSPEESKTKKLVKKTIVISLGLLIIALIITYLIISPRILNIIEGLLVSSTLEENYTVTLNNNSKVIFKPEVYNELKGIYWTNQKAEFKVCLLGEKISNNYYINSLYIPGVYSQDIFSVTSQPCDNKTLISLHSHPEKQCIFSEQDIKNYENFKQINRDAIIGLMCEEARFSFYGY